MIDLMIPPIVAALIILALHAYLGLHILAREIIFVDLAFAQIAALGTTVGLLFGVEIGTPWSVIGALGFTLVGAILFSFTRMDDSPVPQEAIIGIVYVVASAAVILFAGFTPEGAEHVKETLTGTLIWIDWPTILKMGAAYMAVGVFHWVVRSKMLAVSFTPERVARLRLWDFLFYVSFGIAISFSVDIAGVLTVFSSLVIPGVAALLFTARFGPALMLAWGIGAVAVVGGIVASFVWDVATGPLLVCSFGAVLVLAFGIRTALSVKTGQEVVVATLGTEA